ncbi:MAG TPA: anhydro-N-acetylmuramic acid kinase [Sutterella sp.]|nr:anhydro-N-acetylmuramic acid kinase [Sutterella sp.]
MRTKVLEDSPRLFAGAMSGTSLDGIDCVIVEITSRQIKTLNRASVPFSPAFKRDLEALLVSGPDELRRAALASNTLAELYAEAFYLALKDANLTPSSVTALGAHGQTVRHAPQEAFSVQLLNGAKLALCAGVPVVTDFRSADIATGGQGAPLVPAFHAEIFAPFMPCAVLNIGGIANLSFIGHDSVSGFDCGPGNTLIDYVARKTLGMPFDRDGHLAASGKVSSELLDKMLRDPYFAAPPPKSTGREYFNEAWLQEKTKDFKDLSPEDLAATVTALTAQAVCKAFCDAKTDARRLFVCGGGALNGELMRLLQKALPVCVVSSEDVGIHPMDVEGAAFAWLAAMRVDGRPAGRPAVTGASRETILGALYLP